MAARNKRRADLQPITGAICHLFRCASQTAYMPEPVVAASGAC